MGASVSNTTNATAATVGGGQILLWLLACISAGHFIMPSTEVAMTMAGVLVPAGHAICRGVVALFEHWFGVDFDGDGKTTSTLVVTTPQPTVEVKP